MTTSSRHLFAWAVIGLFFLLLAASCLACSKGSTASTQGRSNQQSSNAQRPAQGDPGQSTSQAPAGGDSSVTTVSMTASGYSPGEITVSPGSAIVWVNNSSAPHTVTADPQNAVPGGPDSSADFPNNVPPGSSWTWHVPQDAAPGTVWFYHCAIHGRSGDGKSIGTGMAGSITVK